MEKYIWNAARDAGFTREQSRFLCDIVYKRIHIEKETPPAAANEYETSSKNPLEKISLDTRLDLILGYLGEEIHKSLQITENIINSQAANIAELLKDNDKRLLSIENSLINMERQNAYLIAGIDMLGSKLLKLDKLQSCIEQIEATISSKEKPVSKKKGRKPI